MYPWSLHANLFMGASAPLPWTSGGPTVAMVLLSVGALKQKTKNQKQKTKNKKPTNQDKIKRPCFALANLLEWRVWVRKSLSQSTSSSYCFFKFVYKWSVRVNISLDKSSMDHREIKRDVHIIWVVLISTECILVKVCSWAHTSKSLLLFPIQCGQWFVQKRHHLIFDGSCPFHSIHLFI